MSIVILTIIAIVCAIGWLSRHIATLALIYYMKENGYNTPSGEDFERCARAVTKNLVSDLFK